MADVSEAELWGLKPDAPPALSPAPQQSPMPAPAQPRFDLSERQKWGTQNIPLDPSGRPLATSPYALDVGPPPVPADPNLQTQAHVDDNREWGRAREEELAAYNQNRLSVLDYKPLPDAFTKEQHPEWGKLQTSMEMLKQIPNPKEAKALEPMVRRLEARITHDVEQRNKQLTTTRREQLARDDAPYQSVEARDKTASAMNTHVGTVVTNVIANVGSNDPETARQADFDMMVSPITTMSRPKPGTDPKAKPDATNRDYTPLRNAATDLAIHNRSLPDGESAVRYAIKIATPGGGTDKDGKPLPGFNGRTGAGATNYKVIGRDDLDNWLLLMDDGKRLRVPSETYRTMLLARQQGAQRRRQWEEEYKKSQEPGLLRRAINRGLSIIPEKGF